MAQDRKAKTEEARQELVDATNFARERYTKTKDQLEKSPKSLKAIRAHQVATDELRNLKRELREFDDALDPQAVRRADANPKRSRAAWPVGKPYDPNPRKKIRKTIRKEDTTPLAPPPKPRPLVLQSRLVPDTNGNQERLSWWCGVDRAALTTGANVLATAPPQKTSRPATKAQVKTVTQQQNDGKRDARNVAKREALAGKLQDALKPSCGAFSVIPKAE